jgi:hypothetical protein
MAFTSGRFLRTDGTQTVEDLDPAVSFTHVTDPGTDSGKFFVSFYLDLVKITAAGEVLTTYTPGFPGKILSLDFHVHDPVTTGGKGIQLNAEIGTTDLTGGVVTLTSANCTPIGVQVAGSPVTDNFTFTNAETISIEAVENVAVFAEGSGWLVIGLVNTDTLEIGTQLTSLLAKLETVGLMDDGT